MSKVQFSYQILFIQSAIEIPSSRDFGEGEFILKGHKDDHDHKKNSYYENLHLKFESEEKERKKQHERRERQKNFGYYEKRRSKKTKHVRNKRSLENITHIQVLKNDDTTGLFFYDLCQ